MDVNGNTLIASISFCRGVSSWPRRFRQFALKPCEPTEHKFHEHDVGNKTILLHWNIPSWNAVDEEQICKYYCDYISPAKQPRIQEFVMGGGGGGGRFYQRGGNVCEAVWTGRGGGPHTAIYQNWDGGGGAAVHLQLYTKTGGGGGGGVQSAN